MLTYDFRRGQARLVCLISRPEIGRTLFTRRPR
jgi:hypothetical protein